MKIFATILLAMWMTISVKGQAVASENEFLGVWRQVFSTGGHCGDCTVSISRKEQGFWVDASNGWSAPLTQIPTGGDDTLVGSGKWTRSKSGQAVAREVATGFKMRRGRLILMMHIVDSDGSNMRVKAIFERSSPAEQPDPSAI
ncbi:hypothetical protein ACG873_15025 [Mesorhizobium sp. AaZ16]|uniref:hypothetical protein n=1 Tax=Mesorhizobium sp. AaZ16 TaxID=3402289 RepID=UPI00374F74A5